jgi:hypothetical protein
MEDRKIVCRDDAFRGRGFVVCLSVSRTEGGRRQERDGLLAAVGATAKVVWQWCEVLAVSLALWGLRDRKIGHQNNPGSQHCKPPNEWQIVSADNPLQLIIACRQVKSSRTVPAPKRGRPHLEFPRKTDSDIHTTGAIPRRDPAHSRSLL